MSLNWASDVSSLWSTVVVSSFMRAPPSLPQRSRVAHHGVAPDHALVERERSRRYRWVEERIDVEQRRQAEDETVIGEDDLKMKLRRQLSLQDCLHDRLQRCSRAALQDGGDLHPVGVLVEE